MGFTWRFLRLYLPVAILVIVGAFLYGRSELRGQIVRLQSQEMVSVKLGAGALEGKIETITIDLAYLSSRPQLAMTLDDPSAANLASLAAELVAYARVHHFYDQLRWIDETGMERVRVDHHPANPVVIPAEQLQNKGKRYFFTDTFKLKPGDVFISPLDLNIEQDKVEVPHKPMLRVATPVADALGQKRGIVILNYLGAELLKDFATATSAIADHAYLVNGEGYPLQAPNAEDAWGFMFKRPDLSLNSRSPEAWQRIRSEADGQVLLGDGLWTWQTVYPLLAGQRSSTGAAEAFAPSRGDIESRAYVWKAVAHLPAAALDSLSAQVWRKILWISALILFLSAIGAARLALAMAARAKAEEGLRAANAGLEETVAERTMALGQSISELQSANSRLADNDETLRSILAATQDGYWRVDQSGVIRDVNPAYCELSGYAREELLGLGIQDLEANERPEEIAIHIKQTIAQGRDLFESRHRHKDGSVWDVEISAIFAPLDGGTFFVFSRDISERKRTAAALQAAGERLREAQRIARLGNWDYDHRLGKLTWSDEVYRLFELSSETFCPSYEAFLSVIHQADRDAVKSAFEKSLADRQPYETSHRLCMADGRIKWVTEQCETIFDADGSPLESHGIVQDVTARHEASEALRASEARFRDLVNSTDGIVWEADARTFTFTYISDKAERLLGFPVADWLQPGFWVQGLHPGDRDWAVEHCAACTGRLENHDFEYRFIAKDGRIVWLRDMVTVVAEDGAPRWLRGIMVDITERKEIERRLQEAYQLVDEVQRLSKLGGWRYDCASARLSWTSEVYRIHGVGPDYDPNDITRNMAFYGAESQATIDAAFRGAVERGEPYDIELQMTRATGETIWVRTMGKPELEDGKVVAITGNIQDISERKTAELEIRTLAFYDTLTSLPNRRLFFDRLHQAFANASRKHLKGGLLFIDLDNFKQINDTLGHDIGDLLLQEAAARLKSCVRDGDTVARLGGDEFVVMLETLDEESVVAEAQAKIVGQKILDLLGMPYQLAGNECRSTPSIGIALFTGQESSEAEVVKRADQAMYRAKAAGRNKYCVDRRDA